MTLQGKHICVAALLLAAGCASTRLGAPADRRAAPPGGSGLYVFLREPAGAAVAFELSGAGAMREDGSFVPLLVAAPPSRGSSAPPERLWLSGTVPPGVYVGFRLDLASAGPDVPAGALDVPFPLTVSPDAAVVLIAEVHAKTPAGDGSRVNPEIVLAPPRKIATGLLGLATVRGWGAVALFDKRTGRVSSVLPVGRAPAGLAIDAERLRAYVAVTGEDAVAVLDLVEERVRERVELRAGDAPKDAALTPDGRTLIVANSGSDTVSFVDTAAAVETDRLAVGSGPGAVVVARDGRRAFVVAERASAVTVLDVMSRTVVGSIATDTAPVQARLGGRSEAVLYVAHAWSPNLLVADAASLATLRRVYVGNGARALEVDTRTGRIFLAREGTGKVEVFDPSSFLPIDEIEVQGAVAYLALEREGNGLGVLLGDACEAAIVGVVGRKILVRTGLGPDPVALKFLEAR